MSTGRRIDRQAQASRQPPGERPSRQRRALTREADSILAMVRALRRDLLRNPYADAERYGMTGPQVAVMACLVGSGPTTLTELSRTLAMSHSSASGIVDRLQARGLVRRTEDPGDRRRTRIAVTEGVTRYVRELEDGPTGCLIRALERATPAQRSAINAGLTLLCELLSSPPLTPGKR